MKRVTTRVYSTHNHCMKETAGGGDVRRRSRGSINADRKDRKDRQTDGKKGKMGAGCIIAWLDCD